MIKIIIVWSCKLESSVIDMIEWLVIDKCAYISVINQLLNRQYCIVWLNDCISLGWGHHWDVFDDDIRVLFHNSLSQEWAEPRSSSSSNSTSQLETLEAITFLCLFSYYIKNFFKNLRAIRIPPSPNVSCTMCASNKILWV